MAKRNFLKTNKALAALGKITTTGEVLPESYRAIKELINACDDLNRVFRRNGITSICELEYAFFELNNLKRHKGEKK